MKTLRILASVLVFSLAAAATDTHIAGASNYGVIGRNQSWAANVAGNYILDLISPNTNLCLYTLNNNPVSAHSFTIQIQAHGDLSHTAFTGTLGWRTVFGPATFNAAAGTAVPIFVTLNGAAHVAIGFTGVAGQPGSPDTADIYFVQTAGRCSTSVPWSIISVSGAGGQATVARAASSGTTHFVQCFAGSMAATAATACAPTTLVIRDGACGAGTILFELDLGAPNSAGATSSFGLCDLNIQGSPGQAMCAEFVAGAASCIESVNLVGVDQ